MSTKPPMKPHERSGATSQDPIAQGVNPACLTTLTTPVEVAPRLTILVGDALGQLRLLPPASVDMVLTSPPYFRLRDYGHHGQLGLEDHVAAWVAQLRDVVREARRVLVSTGTLWLNVGDTYSTHAWQGAAKKSLLLAPERLALALVDDGWRLRNKIVWEKSNYLPSPVTDRLACSWEALYVFAHEPRYFFDLDALRVPHTTAAPKTKQASRRTRTGLRQRAHEAWRGPNTDTGGATGLAAMKARGVVGHPLGKNPGDVWRLASSNYRGSHHATFPVALAELAIRAGCPEARCSLCRVAWRRSVQRRVVPGLGEVATRGALRAQCACDAPREPGLALDPFFGVGTTALGALEHRRDWLGIELNAAFAAEGRERIAGYRPVNGTKVDSSQDSAKPNLRNT